MIEISFLTLVSGAVTSLLFEYFPNLNTWFEALSAKRKQHVIWLFLFVSSLLLFGANCAGIWSIDVACSADGLTELVRFVANYVLSVFFATVTHNSTKAMLK